MQIEIIERCAFESRSFPLQRHHEVGDRPAEKAMRHRHRRRGRKRNRIERGDAFAAVLAQDLALVAAGDDLIQARPALTLVVHPHVMLGDADQPRRGIGAARSRGKVLAGGIARQSLAVGIAGVVAERPHLRRVEPFGDQFAFCLGHHLVEAIVAVADAARTALDAELFRRYAEHLCLRQLSRGDDGDIVRRRHSGRQRRRRRRWNDHAHSVSF
ncbi:hypothetical protein ES703_76055 [subsurface metagenome]